MLFFWCWLIVKFRFLKVKLKITVTQNEIFQSTPGNVDIDPGQFMQ